MVITYQSQFILVFISHNGGHKTPMYFPLELYVQSNSQSVLRAQGKLQYHFLGRSFAKYVHSALSFSSLK